jgi:predicted xylose isomerase-like sugar epimerase
MEQESGGRLFNPQAEHKKVFKKLGVEEASLRRREHATQIRKASRDKVISAKRFKFDGDELCEKSNTEFTDADVAVVVHLLQATQPAARDEALQRLRRILSSSDPPLDLIAKYGTVPLLVVRAPLPRQ